MVNIYQKLQQELEQSQTNLLRLTLDLVKQTNSLTNQQLLRILGQKIASGEIRSTYCQGFPYLGIWEKKSGQPIIRICLTTGQVTEKETTHEQKTN